MRNLIFLPFALLLACAAPKPLASRSGAPAPQTHTTVDANNNVITGKTSHTTNKSSGQNKVIFEGKNNLVEVNTDSSYFNARDNQNVTIVRGDRNHLRVDQKNVVDLSHNSRDTMIIEGNGLKVAAQVNRARDFSENSRANSILTESRENLAMEQDYKTFAIDTAQVYVYEINKTLPGKEAFAYYLQEARKGSVGAYYQIGNLFRAGLGTRVHAAKAVEYYEYAARKNHADAARSLARIYQQGLKEIKPDPVKARYYQALAEKAEASPAED